MFMAAVRWSNADFVPDEGLSKGVRGRLRRAREAGSERKRVRPGAGGDEESEV
jgi:hypothetical protein